jgi:hypothetical protein
MKKRIWTGVCTAIVGFAAAAMAAQTSTTPQSANQSSNERRVTVTGCLTAAPPSATDTTGAATAGSTGTTGTAGTAGAAGAASAADSTQRFMLTNATTASGTDTTGSAATSGTTAAEPTGTSGSASSYRLIANPTALGPHVGKKLELTGTIESGSSAAPSSSASAADANAPLLRVESGKVLAASCQQ